jgi:hypothetical protein
MLSTLSSLLSKSFAPEPKLNASVNNQGQAIIKTDDGFTVTFLGKNQAFTITDPGGKTTKIWGDPHVNESDGDRWDFKDKSTFVFGDNKITVETTPRPGNENVTYSQTVTIYNGEDRFTMKGVDKDNLELGGWDFSAKSHDNKLGDGDIYVLNREGESEEWIKQQA